MACHDVESVNLTSERSGEGQEPSHTTEYCKLPSGALASLSQQAEIYMLRIREKITRRSEHM